MQECINTNQSPCDSCGRRLETYEDLQEHIETSHAQSPISPETSDLIMHSCIKCDFTSNSEDELVNHVGTEHEQITSSDPLRFSCDICDRVLLTASHLKEHKETTHACSYITCSDCDYKCKSMSHLNYHIVACHPISSQPSAGPSVGASSLPETSSKQIPCDL